MKKAMIITTVLLVVSFITTLCLGAALGSQGLRALFRDGGIVDRWSQNISDRADVSLYDADWDEEGRQYMFQSDSATLEDTPDALTVTANVGNIRVRTSTGEAIKVVLEQYSRRSNPTSKYDFTVEGGDIVLTAADELDGTTATMTVYVPYALASLSVKTALGDVEITDVSARTLTAQADTGELDVERVTTDTAELRVVLGDMDISGVQITQSLTAENACGDISLDLPASAPFTLSYTVETGSADLDEEIPTEWLRNVQRGGVGASGTLQRDTGGAQYTVHVTLGDFELDRGID